MTNGVTQGVNEKTNREHWDGVWKSAPRLRLPKSIDIGTLNLKRLLAKYVKSGQTFLEIGCAPGKLLAWVERELGATVSGLDYSQPGIESARQLFAALGIQADLRSEDIFQTTFPDASFDVVFSAGVIEHFDDPRDIVRRHAELLKPGGVAVISVPNYGGWMGRMQGWLDPANLAIHNVEIMTPERMLELVPSGNYNSRAFRFGRFSPWILSLDKKIPRPLALMTSHFANVLGHLQPTDLESLSPLVALEIRRR